MDKTSKYLLLGVVFLAVITLLVRILPFISRNSRAAEDTHLVVSVKVTEKTNTQKTKNPNAQQITEMNTLGNELYNLPVRTQDFELSYSPILGKFFVQKKTSGADNAIRNYFQSAGYQDLVDIYSDKSYNRFIFTDSNVDYAIYKAEDVAPQKKVLGVGPVPGETDNPNYGPIHILPALLKTYTDQDLPKAGGAAGGAGGAGGGINLGNGAASGADTAAAVEACMKNKDIYIQAEQASGVPWYILAAIHFREGSCGPNQSVVSGRAIGDNEPDVVAGPGCSSSDTGPGKPIPIGGGNWSGCKFASLLDSAIYAGNLLRGKVDSAPLTDLPTLVKALSYYNGGGNHNCGPGRENVPYTGCPALYVGEDDPYVMNKYDDKHSQMYVIYCYDGVKCNPPYLDSRVGVLTLARAIQNGGTPAAPAAAPTP